VFLAPLKWSKPWGVNQRLPFAILLCGLTLAACVRTDPKPVEVVLLDDVGGPVASHPNSAPLLRTATAEGLVAMDADGKIIPALAERWTVAEDGQSYIFRLRNSTWPDGTRLSGESVVTALRNALALQRGKPMGLDLAPISELRAMTQRVVEIRLARAMPDFLQLLAQPELSLTRHGAGAGPMLAKFDDHRILLTPLPPEKRGLPEPDDWRQTVRPISLKVLDIQQATAAFDAGRADVVLGGGLADLPRVARHRALRLDLVAGLLGLSVEREEGFLANSANREALAMGLDRARLAEKLQLANWASTAFLPSNMLGITGYSGERWTDMDMDSRRATAKNRIANWSWQNHTQPHLRVALPLGPGGDHLATGLAMDFAAMGIEFERVDPKATADLRMVDEVARYPSPSWFFHALHCAVHRPCSPAADSLVAQAETAPTPAQSASLYAQAERELARTNGFIPLGLPVRWSLAPANLPGFAPNRWALHPLTPLSNRPR
jgi:ABC-type transport system substrate-binding protein